MWRPHGGVQGGAQTFQWDGEGEDSSPVALCQGGSSDTVPHVRGALPWWLEKGVLVGHDFSLHTRSEERGCPRCPSEHTHPLQKKLSPLSGMGLSKKGISTVSGTSRISITENEKGQRNCGSCRTTKSLQRVSRSLLLEPFFEDGDSFFFPLLPASPVLEKMCLTVSRIPGESERKGRV